MRSHLTFFNHFPTRLLRNARRAFRAASILLWGAALFAGCTSDIEEGPGLQPEQPASENKLTLSISIPDVSASSPGTYALTTGEEGFQDGQDSFHVLLFGNQTNETTDAKYEFMQFVEPKTDPSSTPGRRNFTIEIPLTDPNDPAALKYKSYKAMVIANYTLEDGGSGNLTERWERYLEKHKDFAAAREKIQFSQAGTWNTAAGTKRYLPLYGESPAFDEKVARIPNIEMRRAVARIDVGVNIGGDTPAGTGGKYPVYDLNSTAYNGNTHAANGAQFTLQSVTLYNAAGAGYVAHNRAADPDADDLSYYVTPLQSDGVPYAYKTETGKTNMFRREIYLPETPNKFDDDTRAFYIVVGGEYNNSGTTTYYRIDFYNREANGAPDATGEGYVKPTKDNRFNILRNNAYVINILEVRGPGHATEEIAAQSEPINMEVDVRSWDTGDSDLGNVVTDGQYNLSVSATRLRYHSDGTAQDLKVFTNYLLANMPEKSGWEMTLKEPTYQDNIKFFDDNGQPVDFKGEGYTLKGEAGITKTLHVGFDRFAVGDAADQMERTVTLVFTAGRMRQEVELIQDVKNLNTLTLTPDLLSFPKRPAAHQPVIVKSSPADAKYYVTWTDDGGTLRRMNISDPDAVREEKPMLRAALSGNPWADGIQLKNRCFPGDSTAPWITRTIRIRRRRALIKSNFSRKPKTTCSCCARRIGTHSIMLTAQTLRSLATGTSWSRPIGPTGKTSSRIPRVRKLRFRWSRPTRSRRGKSWMRKARVISTRRQCSRRIPKQFRRRQRVSPHFSARIPSTRGTSFRRATRAT